MGWTDRNVEFPNRYRMVPVPGTDDIVDLIPAPGKVFEDGTFVNKANMLTDETSSLLGGVDTVNEALETLANAGATRNLPPGGTAGQVLTKRTKGDYDAYWSDVNGGGGGGSIIEITFDPEFAGQEYAVSDGIETVTGTVPEELVASVNVINIDSTYTITAEADGVRCSAGVTVGPYFGRYTAALKYSKIYGVRWSGGPETTMSRTDGAEGFLEPDPFVNDGAHPGWSPFDTLMPWAGMQIVDDPVLGKLVSIPKYWYKWTKSGTVMTLQISDKEQTGFSVSPAHANRGDGKGERSIVYVGRYHCGATAYKSVSGQSPKVNITRATARSAIAALDATAWQYDFAVYWTVAMLYLVEFADWDSQKVIGYGCGNDQTLEACGASDDMPYHTGTMQNSRDTYGVGTQYRYIEGLWENCLDWVDGIYFNGVNIYCIKNPGSFSDTAGGTFTGTRPAAYDFIKAWGVPTADGFEWALYPSEQGGSDSTYVPDYCSYNSATLPAGGSYKQSMWRGLFCLYASIPASNPDAQIGCRLMKLPNKEDE